MHSTKKIRVYEGKKLREGVSPGWGVAWDEQGTVEPGFGSDHKQRVKGE